MKMSFQNLGRNRPIQLGSFLAAAISAATLNASEGSVTFNEHIAPIIYKNCSSCHRPGEAAPFSLMSYEDVARKARMIGKVTAERIMPPWKAEPASFDYRDERRLKAGEIEQIQAWVRQGMPEGSSTSRVEPPQFASGWMLGEPDLVIEMPEAYQVPADGPDIYRNIAVPLGLAEAKWIAAIDMKPSARAVVHHVLYFADGSGRIHTRPQQGGQPGFAGMRAGGASIPLGGWAVGAQPHFFPEGLALHVPKNSDLVVQYHFHPTGKPESEKSKIGLYFAKEAPKRTLTRIPMPPHYALFSGLDIPAGEKDFVIRDSYTVPVAVDAVGVGAHAHYLARQMKMTATLPTGEVQTLLSIRDWDFAWQDRYYFQELVPLPKGTKLEVEIHWDNSAENPRNPSNPPVRVTWGEESKDEMGSIGLIAVAHEESDLKTLNDHLSRRNRQVARERLRSDPALALKVAKILAE